MTKLKSLCFIFCCFALIYAVVQDLGSRFGQNENICENIVFRSLQSWDSTCFYSAIFKDQISLDLVSYEKYKLEKFRAKNGVSPHVKWYFSLFVRNYAEVFDYSEQLIDATHWDLMASAPDKINYHIQYLQYLTEQKRPAQPALDHYCRMYLKNSILLPNIAARIEFLLKEKALELDNTACYNYAAQNRLDSRRLSDQKDT